MPDAPSLVMELAQGQAEDNGCQAEDHRHIHRRGKQSNTEKWQIEEKQNKRQTGNRLEVRTKTVPIVRICAEQLFMRQLPGGEAF